MSVLLYLASFAVALVRVCPSVFADDSPETVTASAVLGIPHPPGAPLLVLLGRLALVLPAGSPGFRLGVLSALIGALAVVLVWRLACRLVPTPAGKAVAAPAGKAVAAPAGRAVAALAAFVLVLWNPVIAQQAAIPKGATYTGAVVLILGAVLSLADRRALRAALLAGLLFALHWMTLAPLFPVLLAGLWLVRPPRAAARTALLCLFLSGLGASAYLLLPVRAAAHPVVDSGSPRTLRLFVAQITRSRYLEGEAKPSASSIPRQALGSVKALHRHFGWGGLALVLAGAVLLFRSRRTALSFAGAAAVLPLVAAVLYLDLPDRLMHLMGVFTIGSWLALACVATAGAGLLASRGGKAAVPPASLAALLLVAAMPLLQWKAVRLAAVDRFTWSYDLSRAMLDPLPPNAGLVVYGDLDTFPLWYQQWVMGRRTDVLVLNCVMLRHAWYRDDAVRRGAPPLLLDAADGPSAVRMMVTGVARPWFTAATQIEGVPPSLKPVPFHLTWAYSRLGGPGRYPRAFPMRGLIESMDHRTEASYEMVLGYTVEVLKNTFTSPPSQVMSDE